MGQTALFPGPSQPYYARIDPRLIDADPNQPRTTFDPADMDSLAASVDALGVMEPLVVEETAGGRYRLVAGERRLRAALAVLSARPGHPLLQAVPAMVYPAGRLPDAARAAMQISENFFRANLSPGDTARGLRRVKQSLECARAEEIIRGRNGQTPSALGPEDPDRRERHLRATLAKMGVPWPDVSWDAVFRTLGMDPADPSLRRVKRLLSIPDPVLDRCDQLGLTRSAAAALSELRDQQKALQLLEAAERAGDPGVVTPAVDLLLADPSITPGEAVDMVLSARRAAGLARKISANGPPDGQTRLKPLCPGEEFERIAAALRDAAALLDAYELSVYQRGSIRLLLERVAEIAGTGPGHGGSGA